MLSHLTGTFPAFQKRHNQLCVKRKRTLTHQNVHDSSQGFTDFTNIFDSVQLRM